MDEQVFAGREPANEDKTSGLSPVRAFLMLAAVATIVPLTILATRPEAAPSAAPSPRTPDFSLTDAEAIAEFERLHESLMRAYLTRDVTRVKTFAAPGSGLEASVVREIEELVSDGVIDRTITKEISTTVVENEADTVLLEQSVIESPRFVDAQSGRDVTVSAQPQRQVVLWALRLSDNEWRLTSGVITSSAPASRRGS